MNMKSTKGNIDITTTTSTNMETTNDEGINVMKVYKYKVDEREYKYHDDHQYKYEDNEREYNYQRKNAKKRCIKIKTTNGSIDIMTEYKYQVDEWEYNIMTTTSRNIKTTKESIKIMTKYKYQVDQRKYKYNGDHEYRHEDNERNYKYNDKV